MPFEMTHFQSYRDKIDIDSSLSLSEQPIEMCYYAKMTLTNSKFYLISITRLFLSVRKRRESISEFCKLN